jgi:hypothetical protein
MAIYTWDAGRYDTTISHLGLKIGDTPSYCNAHGKNHETTFFLTTSRPKKGKITEKSPGVKHGHQSHQGCWQMGVSRRGKEFHQKPNIL